MVSLKTLVRIAGYGGVAVATIGFMVQMSFQQRVRQTTIYKETVETLRKNEKAIKHLGDPVREGRVTIGQYEQNMRWLAINVKGSKTNGSLRCDFVPNIEGVKPSQIYRIEIEFNDRSGRSYVLREDVVEDIVEDTK